MSKGRTYLVIGITILVIVIIICLVHGLFSTAPCSKSRPNAGDIVDCIATRTAEAKNK